MRDPNAPCILLGPQRHAPTLPAVLRDLGLRGPFALITAGWREREDEDDELREAVAATVRNLELYSRTERVVEADGALLSAVRWRRERMRELRDIYRLRLDALMGALRQLMLREGDEALLEAEQRHALEQVRSLDRDRLERAAEVQQIFAARGGLDNNYALSRERDAVHEVVADCEAVLIAGGHVAALLNRLRLFGVDEMVGNRPVIAWSAGAMATGGTIVLFHDSPPQGAGYAETLDRGIGLYSGVIPLPDAAKRLRLDDPLRVRILAGRHHGKRLVPFEPGERLDWRDGRWRPAATTRALNDDGTVAVWSGA
jgi:hypothetical protein